MEEAGAAIEQMNGVALSDSQVLRVAKARERGGTVGSKFCTHILHVTLTRTVHVHFLSP